jgi:hypothetical protein
MDAEQGHLRQEGYPSLWQTNGCSNIVVRRKKADDSNYT